MGVKNSTLLQHPSILQIGEQKSYLVTSNAWTERSSNSINIIFDVYKPQDHFQRTIQQLLPQHITFKALQNQHDS